MDKLLKTVLKRHVKNKGMVRAQELAPRFRDNMRHILATSEVHVFMEALLQVSGQR